MTLLQFIDSLGVFASAVSGLMQARRREMDLVGLYVVALVTAFGGGTLRDLLLDRTPLFWIENDLYAIAILALAILFALLTQAFRIPARWLLIADAFGLGTFSITGAGYADAMGTSPFIAALMGVITGSFGGVIRDILCNEIPALFRKSPLYATCAFFGCLLYIALLRFGISHDVATWLGVLVTAGFRMLAVRFHWTLPTAGSPE